MSDHSDDVAAAGPMYTEPKALAEVGVVFADVLEEVPDEIVADPAVQAMLDRVLEVGIRRRLGDVMVEALALGARLGGL